MEIKQCFCILFGDDNMNYEAVRVFSIKTIDIHYTHIILLILVQFLNPNLAKVLTSLPPPAPPPPKC